MCREKLDEEGCDVWVMTDDHHVLVGRALVQETLELCEGCPRRKGRGNEDGRFVAGFGADELCGLETAFEWARNYQVEVDRERVEDMSELNALALAVFVEWTLHVDGGIGAARAGTSVAKNKQIHAQSFSGLLGA